MDLKSAKVGLELYGSTALIFSTSTEMPKTVSSKMEFTQIQIV